MRQWHCYQRSAAMCAALTVGLAVVASLALAESSTPIIAQLIADPAHYDGQGVVVYGLVIETDAQGSRFLLQDVSQMPLAVVRQDGWVTLVGDQLLVEGRFVANHGKPYLDAAAITHTQVIGGGGCC